MENLSSEARRARIVQLEEELAELRRQEIAEEVEEKQATIEQCRVLKRAGQHIQAVKLYRHKMGVGLREAHDYIEKLGSTL